MKQAKIIQSDFAKRMRALMDERGLTQQQVADAAGVTRASVIKWLRSSYPGSAELYRLSKALGVEMQWFFEVIPHDEPSKGEQSKPLAEVSANALPLEIRRDVENAFEVFSTPENRKAFVESIGQLAKCTLTSEVKSLTNSDVQPELPKLIERLKKATANRGKKVELAKFLRVHRQCVTDWLSGKQKPGGEITLRLLLWVQQQENKK